MGGVVTFKRMLLASAGMACVGLSGQGLAVAAPVGIDPLAVRIPAAPEHATPAPANPAPANPATATVDPATKAADNALKAQQAPTAVQATTDPARPAVPAPAAPAPAAPNPADQLPTAQVQAPQFPSSPAPTATSAAIPPLPVQPAPAQPVPTYAKPLQSIPVQQPAPIVVPPAQIEPSAFLPVPRAWQIDKAILKRKVEALMGEPKAGLVHIADGRPIHPGERSPEMPAIRAALHSFGYLSQETPPALLEPAALPSKLSASKLRAATNPAFVYDDATLEAVKNFQADEGLMDDGIIGGATRRALRSQDSDRLLRLNQTLAQHAIPLASKGREIVVNIAAGLVYALEDGKVVLVSRAVVGNPTHQTPLFSTRIVSVTLNPYWTTPDSITKAEFGGSTHIEHPGPDNPLGKFRLDMPNRYEVFLHSTNEPKLFDRDVRAYSHGCVRVEKVEALAKWLVGDQVWKTTDADATLKTWKYKQIKLSASVPVYLAYWTSSVGSGGQVIYHADPYKLAVPPAPPPAYPVPPGYIGPPPSYGAPPTTVAATRIAVKRPVAKGTTAHRIVHRPSSVQPAPIVEASTMHATGYTTAAVSLPMERN